jgi:hypothetical protein
MLLSCQQLFSNYIKCGDQWLSSWFEPSNYYQYQRDFNFVSKTFESTWEAMIMVGRLIDSQDSLSEHCEYVTLQAKET